MSIEEVAEAHKKTLQRALPSLISPYVIRILGGQSLMLGNAADNPSPTTFADGICYSFDLTEQVGLIPVTVGAASGVLGKTRLGAACPAIDYAKRRYELLGEKTIFVQLAWSGSAVLATSPNGLDERWDPALGEISFLSSSGLVGFTPANRVGMMDNLLATILRNPRINAGRVEFHWQQGPGDADAIYNGTSSASAYRQALDRIRLAVKSNYGVGQFFVWADGFVVGSEAFRAAANAKHAVIHPLEDDFVESHNDVVFATMAFRDVLNGNIVINGDGEWQSGGLDGFIADSVHPTAALAKAVGRRAARDMMDIGL